ncbi:MAG TPA: hypothetical protein VJ276_22630, partial [Thermoanaerobaculia bacterium]|nr:hypothetical protein [Thermoanaerobaculia bacterium]
MLALLLALNLDAIRTIDVNCHGTRHMLHQSRRVDGPLDVEPWSGRTFVDLRGNRLLAETHSRYPTNENFAFRFVLDGDSGFVFDLMRNNQGTEAVALSGKAAAAARWNFTRGLPPLVLRYAAEHGVAIDKDVVEL